MKVVSIKNILHFIRFHPGNRQQLNGITLFLSLLLKTNAGLIYLQFVFNYGIFYL